MNRSVRLDIENLTKIFRVQGSEDVYAVRDCTLTVNPGEILSLLGPSGCGKTTLLRMLAGFEEPTAGTIRADERPVQHLPAHRRDMAMVFQNYALFPHMNVFDNVAYSLKLRRLPAGEIRGRVLEMLRIVGLEGMEDRATSQLSGGQQQRVALARALVKEPSILLLDEPLSNLDVKLRIQMRDELRNLQQRFGITTIYVTHDQEEALALSDRIAVMRQGELEQVGTPRELYERPRTAFVADFLGSTNLIQVDAVAEDAGRSVVQLFGGTFPVPWGMKGGSGLVSIRPEGISLRPWADGEPNEGAAGTVKRVTYLGVWAEYTVQAGDVTMTVRELVKPGAELRTVDERVSLTVHPEAIHPIDA